jgi:hypothetical protein
MGLAGLTAVFGMGTGGAPPVSSPEIGRGEDQVLPAAVVRIVRGGGSHTLRGNGTDHLGSWSRDGSRIVVDGPEIPIDRSPMRAATSRGGQAARLLGPVGCDGRPSCTPGLSTWSSSRSLRSIKLPETSS